MEKESLISIIIPVFNRQDLVKDALDSVFDQTYQAWECIVVDDGSTDDTWKVLEKYAQKDNRFKIHKRNREPKGAPTCRNIGAELSKSDLLIFWDSDDIMAPWCVEERVGFMNENPELDFGLFQLLKVNNNKYLLANNPIEANHIMRFLTFRFTWGTLSMIWRKIYYNKVGGWNKEAKIWQDPEINIRSLLTNPKFKWGSKVPSGIVRFGIDQGSISFGTKEIDLFLRCNPVFSSVMSILPSYYKQVFRNSINARVWRNTYNFPWSDKTKVINDTYDNGLITKYQLNKYLLIYGLYSIIKSIPLIKGLFYRLFIKPEIDRYKVWENEKLDIKTKEELQKRILELDREDSFRQSIEQFLRQSPVVD